MATKIISEIYTIEKPSIISSEVIEGLLIKKFGVIIRWAIVECSNNQLTICLSYPT